MDRLEVSGLAASPNALSSSSDGGGAYGIDSVDGAPDPQRTKQAISQLQQKILKLTEQIKIEQTARDDNVAEYLKLANNADKQQSTRIKQVFEKKNQKSAQTIQQLQRKLEHYHRKLREVEHNGIPRQPKDVLRDMHQGLKDVGAKVPGQRRVDLTDCHYGKYFVYGKGPWHLGILCANSAHALQLRRRTVLYTRVIVNHYCVFYTWTLMDS